MFRKSIFRANYGISFFALSQKSRPFWPLYPPKKPSNDRKNDFIDKLREARLFFLSASHFPPLWECDSLEKTEKKNEHSSLGFSYIIFSTFLKKVFLLQFAGVSCREHINRINREKWRLKELWNHWLEIYTAGVRLRADSVRPCPFLCFRIWEKWSL